MDRRITMKNGNIYLNGEEFKIHSGAIHYFRLCPSQWRDELLKS